MCCLHVWTITDPKYEPVCINIFLLIIMDWNNHWLDFNKLNKEEKNDSICRSRLLYWRLPCLETCELIYPYVWGKCLEIQLYSQKDFFFLLKSTVTWRRQAYNNECSWEHCSGHMTPLEISIHKTDILSLRVLTAQTQIHLLKISCTEVLDHIFCVNVWKALKSWPKANSTEDICAPQLYCTCIQNPVQYSLSCVV